MRKREKEQMTTGGKEKENTEGKQKWVKGRENN